jgi:hypothetical protein
VGCSAFALWRTSGHLLVPRLLILTLTIAALAAVSAQKPAWQLGVVAAGLAAIAVFERHGPALDQNHQQRVASVSHASGGDRAERPESDRGRDDRTT